MEHTTDYASEVQVLVDGFDYELCYECGKDLDRHAISPDMLGKPHVWCLEPIEVEL